MQKKKVRFLGAAALLLACCIVTGGCSGKEAAEEVAAVEETAGETDFNEKVEAQPENGEVAEKESFELREMLKLPAASTETDILNAIQQAIEGMHSGFSMDAAQISFEQDAMMEIKNLYYQIMSVSPSLQYAYDMTGEITDGQLVCTFSYMPFKTGNFPEGFEGVEAASLEELLRTAEENLDKDRVAVRITDASLNVDEMGQVLRQAGDGYFVCMLNSDATEIMIQPSDRELGKEGCLKALEEIDRMADEVIEKCIREGMSEEEKAYALYSYITETVSYDMRYYNDRKNMPYVSMTAYGALHDGLAICGGYSLAVRTLFARAGILCYTVSGDWGGEPHMWNVASIDGKWLYLDATADRGRNGQFQCFAVTAEKLVNHSWDDTGITPLISMEK